MTTTINGRRPEEIKKGPECCINWGTGCAECPYDNLPPDECIAVMKSDNLEYIQQLEFERDEARNDLDALSYANTELHSAYEAMKRERDALIMETKGFCSSCAFRERCHTRPNMFSNSPPHRLHLGDCEDWQWRSAPQEVE